MKRQQASLFDILEVEEAKLLPECPHPRWGHCHPLRLEGGEHREQKTETQWPGEAFNRLTWTCEACGRIRGRC